MGRKSSFNGVAASFEEALIGPRPAGGMDIMDGEIYLCSTDFMAGSRGRTEGLVVREGELFHLAEDGFIAPEAT